jgi:hypothetical protein
VILGNSTRPLVHRYIDRVIAAVNAATPGSFVEVEMRETETAGLKNGELPRAAEENGIEVFLTGDKR